MNLLEAIFHRLAMGKYSITATYSLALYDWFLTFDDELALIYSARWTSVTVTYSLCKYYPLLVWPVLLWSYMGTHNPNLCRKTIIPFQALTIPMQFFPPAVIMIRAYAFSGRDRRVLALLSTLLVTVIVVHMWTFLSHRSVPPPEFYLLVGPTGCFPNSGTDDMRFRIGISMVVSMVMDIACLVVVVWRCVQLRGSAGSLMKTFLAQGLTAFASMCALNIITSIFYFEPSLHSELGLPLLLTVPNLIACRLILQLRRKAASPLSPSEVMRRNSRLIRDAFGGHSSWDMPG
ncbi:hypothetical protein BD779DRAFT_1785970 [Infundibulicybe gibba]|nr:hypothetical protein BD779DRAFT_1785970 [Infundibulicybe gibba]